jgi:7-carboxy-7-deazaguanine synthase
LSLLIGSLPTISGTSAEEASRVAQHSPSSLRAPVQEIFSSTQGEGVYVGKRQIFVRFAHCHLKCAYCDTPMTSPSGQVHVEAIPGSGEMQQYPNPLSPQGLIDLLRPLWDQARHHSISFTGGEPLLYHAFLREAFPLMVKPSMPVYLETSGTQPTFFAEVAPWVDIVAMDIKLPSSTKEAPRYEEHAAFYQLARQHNCFIKLVFNNETNYEELEAVRTIVTDRQTPIILQPETSLQDKLVHVSPKQLFWAENILSECFSDVRIIPQTHKMLNVL